MMIDRETSFLGQEKEKITEFKKDILRLAHAIDLHEPHLSVKKQAKINLLKANNNLSQAVLALRYMIQIDQNPAV